MNKYYEKLKCFFSLNYQLQKIYSLSKKREEFYIDVTIYEYIVNPLLMIELLKVIMYKKIEKPLSEYSSYIDYMGSIYNLRRSFLLGSIPHILFLIGVFLSIVILYNDYNKPIYFWIALFLFIAIIDILYYIYSKTFEVMFIFCTMSADDEKNFLEEWLNTIFVRFESNNLKNIIPSKKSYKAKKRL